MNELEQLKIDLLWLAERQRITEKSVIQLEENEQLLMDGLQEFSEAISVQFEFMFNEFFKIYSNLSKHKKSDYYFRSSLKETHKQNFEKLESVFLKIKGLTKKKEDTTYKYDKIDEEVNDG